MAKEYLERLVALIGPATSGRFENVKLECKHFFSGAAVYTDGRICMSLTPVGFAMKLPEESRNALLKQKGVKHLRYFPNGPIKKDYVVLPKTMWKDRITLRRWVRVGMEYVLTLPEPARKKKVESGLD